MARYKQINTNPRFLPRLISRASYSPEHLNLH